MSYENRMAIFLVCALLVFPLFVVKDWVLENMDKKWATPAMIAFVVAVMLDGGFVMGFGLSLLDGR